ncbi:hypothetical protein KGV31_002157 [Vibrio parahaemolyticus]|nr:hypothetical protein [Vibrio parahaemolyticus]EHU0344300.1 hypothetical protein [Vibrio parahaemolyticus]EHU0354334.1 hypothetical protein [Vibrio parahaemolyticus]
MKDNRFNTIASLLTTVKDKWIKYILVGLLSAYVAADIYQETVIEPRIEQHRQEQILEDERESVRLYALLKSNQIALDYALSGDFETAKLYKFANPSTIGDLIGIE